MITPSQTRTKYVSVEQHLDFARGRVRETLQNFCEPRGYAFVSRVKTLSSLSEKIESGRFKRWSDIDDLIGCAIVVPTLAEEESAIEFLKQAFVTVNIKLRGSSKKAPEVFRFDTTRFIGRLSRPEHISAEDPLYQVQFEIQVRSAFEHAWSVTTHALTYKGQHVDWNRIRLAAQLKAAVEQLDLLILAFEETSSRLPMSSWPETQAKTNLTTYFKEKFESGLLPAELRPQDWTRFSDNIYDMVRSSPWGQNRHPLHIYNQVSSSMDTAIGSLGRERIPLSISLVQFVFASLTAAGILVEPMKGYYPVITSELETLYPALTAFRGRFDFSH